MHVQPIKVSNNNTYKARLINDSNGYLLNLWNKAEKDGKFYNNVKSFIDNHVNEVFEIIDFKSGVYSIIEHRSNTIYKYKVYKADEKYNLSILLSYLEGQLTLFKKLTQRGF